MKSFLKSSTLIVGILLTTSCAKDYLSDSSVIETKDKALSSVSLVEFANQLNRAGKQEGPPVEILYFDWASEALINYHYRFKETDTTSFEFLKTTFSLTVPVVNLDSMNLDYYVEIPEVVEFMMQMNNSIISLQETDYTPALIDVSRIGFSGADNVVADYSVTVLYKKPKYTTKFGISSSDLTFLSFSSICPGGMPAESARLLINEVLDDHYFGQFPSWTTTKLGENGMLFTDVCWGNINGSLTPSFSDGKCVDVYTCSNPLFGHSNCYISPLNKSTCISLNEINSNFNSAKVLANNYRPTSNHQVVHCNLMDGWINYNSNNIFFFDRVYYGKPTILASAPLLNFMQ